jgi:flagellar protein FlaG
MKVENVNMARPAVRLGDNDTRGKGKPDEVKDVKNAEEKSFPNVPQMQPSFSEQHLIEAIESANKVLRGADKRFEFSIHEGTKEIMVKVINDETEEVIREIPPEKILDMVAKMWEMAGILVDRKI